MRVLTLLLNFEALLDIDPSSIPQESMKPSSPQEGVLKIEFVARRRAPDQSIIQVNAFKFFGGFLSGKTELYEYIGPKFVSHNSKIRCTKSILDPQDAYVTAECQESNFQDPRLGHLRATHEFNGSSLEVQTIEARPHVLVYCYRQNITIAKAIAPCPTFPFIVDSHESWSVGSYDYRPTNVQFNWNEKWAALATDIQHLHFNAPLLPGKDDALKRIQTLLREAVYTIKPC